MQLAGDHSSRKEQLTVEYRHNTAHNADKETADTLQSLQSTVQRSMQNIITVTASSVSRVGQTWQYHATNQFDYEHSHRTISTTT